MGEDWSGGFASAGEIDDAMMRLSLLSRRDDDFMGGDVTLGGFPVAPEPLRRHSWFHFHGWAVASYQGGFPVAPEPLRAYLVSFSWLSCGKLSRGLSDRPRTPSGMLGFIFMVELWQTIKGAFRSPPNPFGGIVGFISTVGMGCNFRGLSGHPLDPFGFPIVDL